MNRLIPPRSQLLGGGALAFARVGMGLLWLTNQGWKKPPSFRCADATTDYLYHGKGKGLAWWMNEMVEYSRVGLHSTFVEKVALPHCTAFGWLTFGIEVGAGVLLLLGLFTRVGAVLGLLQSVNLFIGLSNAPGEWVWSYAMMVFIHLLLLAFAAGRYFGVDAVLHERFSRASRAARGDRVALAGALAT